MIMKAVRERTEAIAVPLISLAVGFALWELVGQMEVSRAIPPFSGVVSAIFEVWGREQFQEALISSAKSVAIGFPLATSAGIVVGMLMGRFRVVEWMLEIYVNAFLSMPLVALVPVIVLIFGLDRSSIVAVILLYVFFVVVVNSFSAVKAVDASLMEMGKAFGANEFQTLRRIVLPAALPLILTGVRIAAGRAIKGVIIAEQIIGLVGLGGLVQRYGGAFLVEDLYAVILFIGIVGMLSMETVRIAEARALPWLRGRELGAT
jgi:NitT/TauT family transport system permease protein